MGNGSVIMSVTADASFHGLLGSVLHFVVPLIDPGTVQWFTVFPEEFIPKRHEGLCSVFLLREEPLVSIAFERHFEVEEGHLVRPFERSRLHVRLDPSDEVFGLDGVLLLVAVERWQGRQVLLVDSLLRHCRLSCLVSGEGKSS